MEGGVCRRNGEFGYKREDCDETGRSYKPNPYLTISDRGNVSQTDSTSFKMQRFLFSP